MRRNKLGKLCCKQIFQGSIKNKKVIQEEYIIYSHREQSLFNYHPQVHALVIVGVIEE
ncbi:MAG: hypothetical protein HY934_03350 [Candidatus Firestonebacteria bacterium]|nr:hypothetical protein [Candidatus Firestonebacteria bacterium]